MSELVCEYPWPSLSSNYYPSPYCPLPKGHVGKHMQWDHWMAPPTQAQIEAWQARQAKPLFPEASDE